MSNPIDVDLDRKKRTVAILSLAIFVPLLVVASLWYNRVHPYIPTPKTVVGPVIPPTPDGFFVIPPKISAHFENSPNGKVWVNESQPPSYQEVPDGQKIRGNIFFTKDGHPFVYVTNPLPENGYGNDIVWRTRGQWYGILYKDTDVQREVDSSLNNTMTDCWQCGSVILVEK